MTATVTSIGIVPANPSVAKKLTVQLFASCTFSDNSTQDCTNLVDWSSSAPGTATVEIKGNPNPGLVTGQGVGSATITAALDGVSGTTTVEVTAATIVSIAVEPANSTVVVGGTKQLVATATLSDGTPEDITNNASWSSSSDAVATVDGGKVTGVAPGTATITVEQSGVKGTATVTVVLGPEFAYVTDNTANTVSVFSVGANGVLTQIGPPVSNPGRDPSRTTMTAPPEELRIRARSGSQTSHLIWPERAFSPCER